MPLYFGAHGADGGATELRYLGYEPSTQLVWFLANAADVVASPFSASDVKEVFLDGVPISSDSWTGAVVSGNYEYLVVKLTLDDAGRYDFNSVSGDVTLYLPPERGVESRGTSISGKLWSDLPHEYSRRGRGSWPGTSAATKRYSTISDRFATVVGLGRSSDATRSSVRGTKQSNSCTR